MSTGYVESDWASIRPSHSNLSHCCYGNGQWLAGAWDGVTDSILFSWDGVVPPNPGDEGNWPREAPSSGGTGGGDVGIGDRSTDSVSPHWDPVNEELHVYADHGSTPEYRRLQYNSGSNDWTYEIGTSQSGERVNPPAANLNACVLDTATDFWVLVSQRTSVDAIRRTRAGGWQSAAVIATFDDTADNRIAASRFVTAAGADAICAVWNDTDGANKRRRFGYHVNGQPDGTWTLETIDANADIDNHFAVQAAVLGADTEATVWAVTKESGGGITAYRRAPGGVWSTGYSWAGTFGLTRPRVVIDQTNGNALVFAVDAGDLKYWSFDATANPTDEGAPTVAIDDQIGPADLVSDFDAPPHPCTSATGVMVRAWPSDNSRIWWNQIALAGAPPVETVNASADASAADAASAQIDATVNQAGAATADAVMDGDVLGVVTLAAGATAGDTFDPTVAFRVNVTGQALASAVKNVLGAIEGTASGDAAAGDASTVNVDLTANQLGAALADATMSAVTEDLVQMVDGAIAAAEPVDTKIQYTTNLDQPAIADAVLDPIASSIVNLIADAQADAGALGGSQLEVLMMAAGQAAATASGDLAVFTVDTPTSRTVVVQGSARTVAIRRAKRTIAINRGELDS